MKNMSNTRENHNECNMTNADCSSCQRLQSVRNKRSNNFAISLTFPQLLLLLLLSLSSILAAPQTSCIMCNKEDLQPREPTISASYEEFTFDHQVKRQDAIQALRAYNETHETQNSCNTKMCTTQVVRYCLSPQFLNDHCWCEMQHSEEGVPYVPHVCYVGEKVYAPSLGSCFTFQEIKECCCAPVLVKEWRHISGALSATPKIMLTSLLATIALLNWRCRRRSVC
ncbi:uncharacterized protein LOC133842235 isoform X1 [Drosophila sulfurigaster albostrigata]|uniref:uncharacterized protein LOC133842235 isoform X1 n=1 Tax=Drosophila sulfurigaster albostrigata TaxID=89887 RepID=UPI002D21942F|nr:uncharacterized protein LOC133842235 isoform X1 [Drosophila sulfurigaster albostrigata]XP_062131252.1 uncharacterized protein LOC133842235 isoform X1 [Drosophila sulfurigaster albostrigata]XP_062131253.1 uncharacterized protein LOC133842235 isoform X1 [Drosophila sulfurigaster albostrigata]